VSNALHSNNDPNTDAPNVSASATACHRITLFSHDATQYIRVETVSTDCGRIESEPP